MTWQQLDSILREAERAGIDSSDVLESLDFARFNAPDARAELRIPLSDFFRIEGEIARRLDDLTAHLSKRKLTYDSGAYVNARMDQSTTLEEALYHLAQFFNMMHGEHYNVVTSTDRTVTLTIDDANFPYTPRGDAELIHFIGDCVMIMVYCLLDSLSHGIAANALKRVSLKRPKRPDLPGHLRVWAAPLSFGQDNYKLAFDRTLALAPMSSAKDTDLSSEGIFSRVVSYLEQATSQSRSASYRARTLDLIRSGVTEQETVANRLSISIATLRRRLEQERTSFRDLTNAHFVERAESLLRKGFSVAHVSETLNYSDIRAFNRAFKRQTGETPAQFAARAGTPHR